jgi:hypothetical protein
MIRSAALALLMVAPSLPAAPVPEEVRKGDPYAGTWRLESLVAFGKPVEFTDAAPQYVTLNARGGMIYHAGPALPENAEAYALLAFSGKSDAVDFRFTGDDDYHRPGKCTLKNDVLKLCFNFKDTGIRPATTDAGAEVFVWTLHRVKPEAKK